jgi:hypothetical protein
VLEATPAHGVGLPADFGLVALFDPAAALPYVQVHALGRADGNGASGLLTGP